MAEIRTIGIKSIKFGSILPDGGMATTLAALGCTYEGTARFEGEDAQVSDFFSEESDDPIETVEVAGKKTLVFNIVDFTAATLIAVMGGTADGTKWVAPAAAPTIEKSIEIISKKDLHIEITRAKVSAKFVMDLSKNALGQVEVRCTVLVPTLVTDTGLQVFYQAP